MELIVRARERSLCCSSKVGAKQMGIVVVVVGGDGAIDVKV